MSPASPLGPVLMRKTLPRANGVVVLIFSAALLYVVVAARSLDAAAIGLTGFALLLILMAVWTFTYRAEIHEGGVTTSSLFGKRSITFAELKSFSYARTSTHGQLRDTIAFLPQEGKPVRVVTQPGPRSGGDRDLAALSGMLSEKFALKMQQDLVRRGRVEWLTASKRTVPAHGTLALSRDGYIIGNAVNARTILFSEVDQEIVNGRFALRRRDNRRTEFQCSCIAENFYPGLTLSRTLQGA
jgi:hypothetical protein